MKTKKNQNTEKKPQKRDAQKTRAKILSCATECFSGSGYEGTSLKDILDKAKVNKRMVYHYYGSKESLYRSVHLHQWKMLNEWLTQRLLKTQLESNTVWTAKTLLLKSTEIFHDFCASHQEFIRLLLWDGLEGGAVSRSIWEEGRAPLYEQIVSLVKGVQSKGLKLGEIQADHLVVSFLGSMLFYFAYANSLSDIFGNDPLDKNILETRKDQILKQLNKILTS